MAQWIKHFPGKPCHWKSWESHLGCHMSAGKPGSYWKLLFSLKTISEWHRGSSRTISLVFRRNTLGQASCKYSQLSGGRREGGGGNPRRLYVPVWQKVVEGGQPQRKCVRKPGSLGKHGGQPFSVCGLWPLGGQRPFHMDYPRPLESTNIYVMIHNCNKITVKK